MDGCTGDEEGTVVVEEAVIGGGEGRPSMVEVGEGAGDDGERERQSANRWLLL